MAMIKERRERRRLWKVEMRVRRDLEMVREMWVERE